MTGKKKRGHPDIEELLARPFCYYCERDFDDLKILISHQKAKHFKCERCGRRLNTAGGLSVHMNQVHKETLTSVDNALGNRASLDVEIFGMEGIPEDVLQAHNQRIIQQFYQAEAERRAATGNQGPGAGGAGGQAKKPKFESPADLKKRLAEHKARMAEQAAGGSSGGNTPGVAHSPQQSQSPGAFNASPYPPPQIPYGEQQGASYGSFSQPQYAPPVAAYQQPYPQQPAYSPPGGQVPPAHLPFAQPPQQYPPQQPFPGPTGYQQPPHFPGAPQHPYPAVSPPGYTPFPPPGSHALPQHALPTRPPSLPQAPGLPQRPSFGATPPPHIPAQGPPGWAGNGWSGPGHQNPAMSSAYPPHSQGYNPNASTVDDLISGAAREPEDDIDKLIRMAEAGIKPPKKADLEQHQQRHLAHAQQQQAPPAEAAASDVAAPVTATTEVTPAPEATEKAESVEKKSKKDKDKNTRMVYSDNEVSPEEKLAKLPRYAFVPENKEETVLAAVNEVPGVAGTVDQQAEQEI